MPWRRNQRIAMRLAGNIKNGLSLYRPANVLAVAAVENIDAADSYSCIRLLVSPRPGSRIIAVARDGEAPRSRLQRRALTHQCAWPSIHAMFIWR